MNEKYKKILNDFGIPVTSVLGETIIEAMEKAETDNWIKISDECRPKNNTVIDITDGTLLLRGEYVGNDCFFVWLCEEEARMLDLKKFTHFRLPVLLPKK